MPIAALHDWLRLGHILAAMVWLGGTGVPSASATRTLRGDAGEIARFVGSLRIVGPVVLAPAPVLLIALGIWLVADSAAWNFDQTWVQTGLGLFVLAFLYGAAFQSRAAISAERAATAGDADTARRRLVRWTRGTRVILLLLPLATWDMVLKPNRARRRPAGKPAGLRFVDVRRLRDQARRASRYTVPVPVSPFSTRLLLAHSFTLTERLPG